MSGSAGRCEVMPAGCKWAGDREACAGGGSGNISLLVLCLETLAFISDIDELKRFVRICQNMQLLQHAVLRPVSRTVTLWKALFYRFPVRPYPPHCWSHVGYSQSELLWNGVRTLLADVANVRSGRLCTEMWSSRRHTALRACLHYW